MSRINIRYYKKHPPRLLTPLERQIVIVYRSALTSWYDEAYSNLESMKTWICECEKERYERNKIRMLWNHI